MQGSSTANRDARGTIDWVTRDMIEFSVIE
jgi:hypothetical protein